MVRPKRGRTDKLPFELNSLLEIVPPNNYFENMDLDAKILNCMTPGIGSCYPKRSLVFYRKAHRMVLKSGDKYCHKADPCERP